MGDEQRPLVIWGAGGHAKVLAEFAADLGFSLVALFDNDSGVDTSLAGVSLYRGRASFDRWLARRPDGPVWGVVAIGGWRGRDRLDIQALLETSGIAPATMVHPRAFVARTAHLGEGSQILANASVCADASVGAACIINTNASVDHECVIADGVHVAPGACLAGCVRIERCSLVGPGAVVLPRVSIGRDVVIGAGAVVTRDVPDGVVAYGNPARIVRRMEI